MGLLREGTVLQGGGPSFFQSNDRLLIMALAQGIGEIKGTRKRKKISEPKIRIQKTIWSVKS